MMGKDFVLFLVGNRPKACPSQIVDFNIRDLKSYGTEQRLGKGFLSKMREFESLFDYFLRL